MRLLIAGNAALILNKHVTSHPRRNPHRYVRHVLNQTRVSLKIESVHLNRYLILAVHSAIARIDFASALWWINRRGTLEELRCVLHGFAMPAVHLAGRQWPAPDTAQGTEDRGGVLHQEAVARAFPVYLYRLSPKGSNISHKNWTRGLASFSQKEYEPLCAAPDWSRGHVD